MACLNRGVVSFCSDCAQPPKCRLISVSDYDSAGDEGFSCGYEAARERRPLFLAGIACAAAPLATPDFDPERGLPLRAGGAADF